MQIKDCKQENRKTRHLVGISKWWLFEIIIGIFVPGILLWDSVDNKTKQGDGKHQGVNFPASVDGPAQKLLEVMLNLFPLCIFSLELSLITLLELSRHLLKWISSQVQRVLLTARLGWVSRGAVRWCPAHQLCGPGTQLLHIYVYKYPCISLLPFFFLKWWKRTRPLLYLSSELGNFQWEANQRLCPKL